jgi:tripartite-type tricarboxylate transporter receptor subunit TctC
MPVDIGRRRLLAVGAASLLVPHARAQAWPSRPIRIVCPLPPGGLTDLYSRAIAEHLQQSLGQTVIVENRPGAGGQIGCDLVAKAAPDGYTFLVTIQTSLVQAQVLYKKLPYNPDTDFSWISALGAGHLPLGIQAGLPVKTFRDYVEYAKANRTHMGTYAPGSYPHMVAGQLNKLYGTKIDAVHYKGEAPMWLDVISGQTQAAIGSVAGTLPHIQKGSVRVLAVPTKVRSPKLPEVPTFIRAGLHRARVLDRRLDRPARAGEAAEGDYRPRRQAHHRGGRRRAPQADLRHVRHRRAADYAGRIPAHLPHRGAAVDRDHKRPGHHPRLTETSP